MKYLLSVFCLLIFIQDIFSQDPYWILFTDKKGVVFDPFTYFDPNAIERRIRYGIALDDSTDYPVNSFYKETVSAMSEGIAGESRWINAVYLYCHPFQAEEISHLPFVKEIIPVGSEIKLSSMSYPAVVKVNKELLTGQTESLQGELFTLHGYDGKGIRIAIFDAGFPGVDVNPVFEHIRKEGRIIRTYDFTKKKDFVYSYNGHGTAVMSCIAGMLDTIKIGLATGAEFLLARTEVSGEPFSEEVNWLAAVEWADKNGADIINSSLGYTNNRYFPKDMNGKTSLVVRAANIAASKGILVVNAMGNEGTSSWKTLGTPADADSILSIGGIDHKLGYHIDFSSYGPTADKRRKPNVSAYGHVVAASKTGVTEMFGTSFSSPLVAGFAACAWQSKRNLNNMDMFREIEKSATLYPYYDYAHGYGVPQASYFVNSDKPDAEKTFDLSVINDSICITTNEKYIGGKTPAYLYYHIENSAGSLDRYAVVEVYQTDIIKIPVQMIENSKRLRVHYRGFTASYPKE